MEAHVGSFFGKIFRGLLGTAKQQHFVDARMWIYGARCP